MLHTNSFVHNTNQIKSRNMYTRWEWHRRLQFKLILKWQKGDIRKSCLYSSFWRLDADRNISIERNVWKTEEKFRLQLGFFVQQQKNRNVNRPFCNSIQFITWGEKIFLQLNLILILLGKFPKSFHKLFWLHLDETRLYIFFTATMNGINIRLTPTTPSSLIEPSSNFSSFFQIWCFRRHISSDLIHRKLQNNSDFFL